MTCKSLKRREVERDEKREMRNVKGGATEEQLLGRQKPTIQGCGWGS
jgi:hypothetical protein